MDISQLKQLSAQKRAEADQIDEAIATLEKHLSSKFVVAPKTTSTITHKSSTSGARKSDFHPNMQDKKVLDAMITLADKKAKEMAENSENENATGADFFHKAEIKKQELLNESGVSEKELNKALNFLKNEKNGLVQKNGHGRGTSYSVLVTTNNLDPKDPAEFGDTIRKSDGPPVQKIVRAIFNTLDPEHRVKSTEVAKLAMEYFPWLSKSSFGNVFSKMTKAGEIVKEGEFKNAFYYRGPDLIPDAVELPEKPTTTNKTETSESFDEVVEGDDDVEATVVESDETTVDNGDDESSELEQQEVG